MESTSPSQVLQMAQARQALSNPSVFIRSVTELADRREVVASEDIYAQGGMKLIASGTKLSGNFYERLVAHKLLKPIEASIAVADLPSAVEVIAMAHAAAQRIPSLRPLLGDGMLVRLGKLLSGATIPLALATKLAVMQDTRPRLFEHSLIAATIAMVLGIRADLSSSELRALALASLFHDIGELYIDPDFFDPSKKMSMSERRHLYVHPIAGYLVLREFPELPKETARAVLQHHERLDGAGYPYRLKAEVIQRVSRFLAVAEVAASLLEHHGADRRIGMKFRMNIQKYDPQAVTLISGLFDSIDPIIDEAFDERRLFERLGELGQVFAEWQAFLNACQPSDLEAIEPVVNRLNGLRMMVLEPCFDQCRLEDVLGDGGVADPQVCTELTVMLDEMDWQLRALSRGVERDLLVWGMKIPEALRPAFNVWLEHVRAYIAE